eukprot:TRINITY_DN7772_c0_g1_i1.p1 TRINITY_DN7772_c0_g1~~TRINITY_DN7772_c0_g1_i1.p1  ORF type:complete len:204 (+),score=32.24 TRINITY_DN7772_c0_g1_i1:39-614(+)
MPKKTKSPYPIHNLVVAGGGGSGKSALTQMFIYGNFIEEYDPTTADNYSKVVDVDGVRFQLEILDTAGQEDSLRATHKTLGEGYLVVYSVVERTTFEAASKFHDFILTIAGKDEYPTVLIGTKIDLEKDRKVTFEEGEGLAKKWNCPFFEASSKTKINVEESFTELVRVVVKWKQDHPVAAQAKKKNCILS